MAEKNMKKIYQYILMAVAVVATIACSNEIDEPMQPAHNGTLQFVVCDFPAFGEGPEPRAIRAIGTQDVGKTNWEDGDEIIVTLAGSQKYGTQTAAITYDGSEWTMYGSLRYLDNETPTVSAIYAPCYELTGSTMNMKTGMQLGMTEYLEADNCTLENGIICISFAGVTRDYSRLRIVGLAGETYTVATNNFTPAGDVFEATEPYTLTADEKGNAYLYGTFAEGGLVTVKDGDTEFATHTFNVATKAGGSYALYAGE